MNHKSSKALDGGQQCICNYVPKHLPLAGGAGTVGAGGAGTFCFLPTRATLRREVSDVAHK